MYLKLNIACTNLFIRRIFNFSFGHDISMEVVIFKGITHLISAIIIFKYIFGSEEYISVFLILGALFPDIDYKYSPLGKFNIFAFMMKHRGFMHTPLALIIISIPLYFFNPVFCFHFAFGYLIHLLEDSLTRMGIMWLYPYRKKYYSVR